MSTRRFDPGEVRGNCCPACGTASGIRRERRIEAYNSGHLLLAAIFGLIGALAAMASRSSEVRLRCTKCQCRFPEPLGIASFILIWIIISLVIAGIAYILTMGHPILTGLAAAFILMVSVCAIAARIRKTRRRSAAWKMRRELEIQGSSASVEAV